MPQIFKTVPSKIEDPHRKDTFQIVFSIKANTHFPYTDSQANACLAIVKSCRSTSEGMKAK